jgi:hypothetical protein
MRDGHCIRTDKRLCLCGEEGYFIKNSFQEEVTALTIPGWKGTQA